jgi:hypothetical protein
MRAVTHARCACWSRLTVALQPGVTSRHKLSAKHLDLIEPGETVPVLIVQGGDGEAAMTLWQRAQTYLNSDVVGATISVVRLTANPSARILKKAMATLAMLMDGGNPDVQRSVLKVINEGTTASSGVSVNLLQQLSLQFDSVVARTLSSPWWLDATQLVPALQTRALVPAAAGGGAGAGAGALTAASASGGAGGVGSAAADGMSAAVVPATLHDTGVVQPMLKFVKQLCENHKLEAQNVLREQKDSSYNIIQHLLHYLDSIVPARMPQWTLVQMDTQPERIRELLRPIATALEALTETIQGPCVGNQRVVLDGQGLEVLTNIVAMQSNLDRDELLGATTLETHRRIDALEPEREVFNLAVVCLESLIEGPSFAVNSRTMLAKSISSHLVRHLTVYGNVLLDGQCGFVVGGGIVTNAVRSAADGSTELGSALLHEAMEMYKLLRLLQLERGFGFVEGSSAVFSDAQLDPAHLELFERHLGMVEIARDSVVEPFVYQHDRLFGLVTRDDRRHLLRTRGTNQAEKLDNFVLELEALRVTLQLRDRVRRSKFRDRISSEKFERCVCACVRVRACFSSRCARAERCASARTCSLWWRTCCSCCSRCSCCQRCLWRSLSSRPCCWARTCCRWCRTCCSGSWPARSAGGTPKHARRRRCSRASERRACTADSCSCSSLCSSRRCTTYRRR